MNDEATSHAPAPSSDARELSSSAAAIDALLRAVEELPPDAQPRVVAGTVVKHLSAAAPGARVGTCVVHPLSQERFVELGRPGDALESLRDPSRLFPNAPHEVILPLDGITDSTLHFAPAGGGTPTADTRALLERAARILSRLLSVAFQLESREPGSGRLTAQLVQTEKFASFGRVVANVVHELANPLTSIIAYADHLRRSAAKRPDDGESIDRIDRISESAQRILSLSRDLISYARPASAEPEPVALHEVMERALTFCDHELSSRSVRISRDFDAELPAVRGTPGPLVQVFVNLFTNAAHAMASGGHLTLVSRCCSDRPFVRVDVTDTGTGMSEEILARVFEPFFTTKESEMGSGLGLVIVREIITAQGGSIRARSTLGAGTTFTIELPNYGRPNGQP